MAMEDVNRRQLLIAAGATTVASGALAAPGLASGGAGDGGSGRPVLTQTPDSYRLPLATKMPPSVRPGGSITKALPDNFPVLEGNEASAGYLVLKPGALREPHWHPTHWEMDYAVQGKGELGIVTPDDQQSSPSCGPATSGSSRRVGRTTSATSG